MKQKKHWELPPLPTHLVADDDDSSDEDDNDNEEQKVETNAVDNTVKEKVERIKKMSFPKFECKDVGIPTYKKDKRENDDDHKPLGLKSPFVEVEIEGKESIFIRKCTAV